MRLGMRFRMAGANEEEEGEGADDKEKEGAVAEEYRLEGKERLRYCATFIPLHLARRKCLLLGLYIHSRPSTFTTNPGSDNNSYP